MILRVLFSAFLMVTGMYFLSAQENSKTLIHKGNKEFEAKNYDKASSKYMEALQVEKDNFTAHYNLGNALYKREMFEEAKAEYQKAEKLAGTLSDKSASLYNLGNAYMKKNEAQKAAELYKQALKQDPYNESIRKNYEIAMLKEKERQQQQQQEQNAGGGGKNQSEQQQQGEEKGDQAKTAAGKGQQDKGSGDGEDPNKDQKNNANRIPKEVEDAILNRVGNKERETARRILNKNSYSMPQSNEKDW